MKRMSESGGPSGPIHLCLPEQSAHLSNIASVQINSSANAPILGQQAAVSIVWVVLKPEPSFSESLDDNAVPLYLPLIELGVECPTEQPGWEMASQHIGVGERDYPTIRSEDSPDFLDINHGPAPIDDGPPQPDTACRHRWGDSNTPECERAADRPSAPNPAPSAPGSSR